jgi:predicted kinase
MKLHEEISRLKEIMGLILESDDETGKLFILVGPPSVGKSTWIRNYPEFEDESPYVINRDDIVEEVASSYGLTYDDMFAKPSPDENIGDENPKYGKVIESPPQIQQYQKLSYNKVLNANNEINKLLEDKFANAADNKYIVVDMTNMSKFARQNALNKLSPILPGHKKVAVVFNFKGGEDLIKQMAQKRSEEYKSMGKSKTIPPEAFDRMFSSFQDVSTDEGFDDIIQVDNIPSFKGNMG